MDDLRRWDDARLLADRDHPGATFAVFYRRHATSVLAFFARREVDVTRAGELTAATFAAALAGRYGYQSARASAAPWLHRLATAELRSAGRRPTVLRRLRSGPVPRVALDATDRREYRGLAHSEFDVLDVLAELPRYRPVAGRAAWAPRRAGAGRTEDARG